jgi:hypothetical protein
MKRYLHDYLRVLGTENDKEDSFDSFNTTAVVGIRFRIYLLLMRGIDNELRPRISLEEV